MPKKPSLTIGIPAYNEARNLLRLLKEIKKQNTVNYNLRAIIISLDGSTDESYRLLGKLGLRELIIINNQDRIGKPLRLNQIFSRSHTDIIVTLDADIHLASADVLSSLIEPFIKDNHISYVSGVSVPEPARSFVQHVARAGIGIWNNIKKNEHNPMYFSEGAVRAFRRSFYLTLVFPDTSADDVYPYIFARIKGLKFYHSTGSIVIYHLPSTFKDYINQQYRYLQSPQIQRLNFGEVISKKYFQVGFLSRYKAFIDGFSKSPVYSTVYIFIWLYVRLKILFSQPYFTSQWDILKTTK